jgi:hypothetical protein
MDLIERAPAIMRRTVDSGNRQQARSGQVFLLHVDEYDYRRVRCVCECPNTHDGSHAVTLRGGNAIGRRSDARVVPAARGLDLTTTGPAMVVVRPVFWQV